jgi:hypothetical protein
VAIVYAGTMLIIICSVPFTYASSNNVNPGVFPPDSKPYGLTYAEWSAKWWEWFASISPESNPANDETGKNCAIDQKTQMFGSWLVLMEAWRSGLVQFLPERQFFSQYILLSAPMQPILLQRQNQKCGPVPCQPVKGFLYKYKPI